VNLWMKGYQGRTLFTVEAPYSRAVNPESVPEELYHKKLPTLVVRQDGEARTRPFVAVIDAINEGEDVSVRQVSYFSPEVENHGFVGISVLSNAERVDKIFNDESGEKVNSFGNEKFQGTYGIVSMEKGLLHALFLGNGKLLEEGNWKIETENNEGTVLVQFSKNGMTINAPQSSTLTMPVNGNQKGEITLKAKESAQQFLGKVTQKNNQKVAEFQLPALKNIQFEIQ
jgi:hypothetical protein